jgi:hypothetical protein
MFIRRLRGSLSYANVMSTIAVVIALGGTAYAAATITGADVVDESLTGADILNKSVQGGDLAGASIGGNKLIDGSITGTKLSSTALNVAPADIHVVQATPTYGCNYYAFCYLDSTNNWHNYGNGFQPARFFKDRFGIVHFEGSIAGGGPHIMHLPPEYSPQYTRIFKVQDDTDPSGYIKISSLGEVVYKDYSQAHTVYLQLDGISYLP